MVNPCTARIEEAVDLLRSVDPTTVQLAGLPCQPTLTDHSTAARGRAIDALLRTMVAIDGTDADGSDLTTKSSVLERLSARFAWMGDLATIAVLDPSTSPLHDALVLCATRRAREPHDLDALAQLMGAVSDSLKSWRSALRDAALEGHQPRRRAVDAIARSAASAGGGAFSAIADAATRTAFTDSAALRGVAAEADAAARDLGDWAGGVLAPRAGDHVGVGPASYPTWLRAEVGTNADPAVLVDVVLERLRELLATSPVASVGPQSVDEASAVRLAAAIEIELEKLRRSGGAMPIGAVESVANPTAEVDGYTVVPALDGLHGPSRVVVGVALLAAPASAAAALVVGHVRAIAAASVRPTAFERRLFIPSAWTQAWTACTVADGTGVHGLEPAARTWLARVRLVDAALALVDLCLHGDLTAPPITRAQGDAVSTPRTEEEAVRFVVSVTGLDAAAARRGVACVLGRPGHAVARALGAATVAEIARRGDEPSAALAGGPLGLDALREVAGLDPWSD